MENNMQIHRRELDLLLKWLNKPNRKPLVIRGARQVGKSTLVRNLAKISNRFCLELNFERFPELSDFFVEKEPKKIIEKHKGEIQVKSQIGIGTVFNIFLPERQNQG